MLARDTLTGYLHEVPDALVRGLATGGLGGQGLAGYGEVDDGLGLPFAPLLAAAAPMLGNLLGGLTGGGGGGGAPAGGAAPAAGAAPIFIPIPSPPQIVPIPIPVPYPAIRVPVPMGPGRFAPGPHAPGGWAAGPAIPGVTSSRIRRRRRR